MIAAHSGCGTIKNGMRGEAQSGTFPQPPFRHKKRLVVELECRAGIHLSNEMKFRIGLNAFHHLSNACPRHLFIFLFTPKGKRERYSKVQTSLHEIRLFRAIYWTIPSDRLQRHKHRHGLPAQNHPFSRKRLCQHPHQTAEPVDGVIAE